MCVYSNILDRKGRGVDALLYHTLLFQIISIYIIFCYTGRLIEPGAGLKASKAQHPPLSHNAAVTTSLSFLHSF